ncbi:MFS transporter [Streptomyces dioscori]|uniref:MFS transporter n=1 Tax=Streptomyces dioscori TaxID=2109333 RepID=A0A2P8Q9P8_9ACTN|nr:MFS transporter [Streptomyces dioscori]PSM42981.1 MFS transporter [Streptomyces dioscori]
MAMLSVSAVSYALVQSMVNPGLEALREHVGASRIGVSWVLAAFLLSSAVLTPVLGRLGDQIGKRRILVAVLLVLAAGSVVAALATTLPMLLVGRVLQGAGGAAIPLSFGIVRDLMPADQVSSKVGAIAAVSSVGVAIGVLVAGPIISALGVSWLFWLPAIANGIMALGVLLFVPETPVTSTGKLNYSAAVLLAGTLVLLLLPLTSGQRWGWGSVTTLGLFAAAVAAGVLWATIELRSKSPLIDMRVFRMRPVWTANLASFLFGFTLFAAFGFIPAFLQTPVSTGYGLGESITVSGLLFLPVAAVQFLTGLAAGPLARRFSVKALLVVGSLPIIIGFLLLARFHGNAWLISLETSIVGIGFGIGISALAAVVVHAVPAEHTGAAAGMNANVRTIGGAVGTALVATVLASHTGSGAFPDEAGYSTAFLLLAVGAVAVLAACLLIPAGKAAATIRSEERETVDEIVSERVDQRTF